jgi:hypothetical protein
MDPPRPETSAFHHRGGLQVPGSDYRDPVFQPAGGQPQTGYQPLPPSDYPYQNLLAQQQQQGLVFPSGNSNDNFLSNPYSPYVQQFQQQYSSQFAPQYGLQQRLPPPPPLPPQQGQQQLQQQVPQLSAAAAPATAAAEIITTATASASTAGTTRTTTTPSTTTAMSEVNN